MITADENIINSFLQKVYDNREKEWLSFEEITGCMEINGETREIYERQLDFLCARELLTCKKQKAVETGAAEIPAPKSSFLGFLSKGKNKSPVILKYKLTAVGETFVTKGFMW